jgi:hypothetical protein
MKEVGKSFVFARLMAALGVVALAHLVDVGGTSRLSLWADLFNAGHVVLMGAFSLVMLSLSSDALGDRITNRLGHYLTAFSVTVLVGGLSEVIQIPGPRNADILDVARDAAGAFSFLGFRAIRDRPMNATWARWGRWPQIAVAAVAATVLVISWSSAIRWGIAFYRRNATFPILATFDSRGESLFWTTRNAGLRRSPPPPSWSRSEHGMVGELISYPSTRSGFAINKVYPAWTGYESLQLSVYLDSDPPTIFTVQVEDSHYSGANEDRLTFAIEIQPGANVVTVPLKSPTYLPSGRPLDVGRIERVYFLTGDTTRTITLYVDNIVLR